MSVEHEIPVEGGPEMLRRREILRRAAWLLGGTISAPAALAILQGCSAKQEPGVVVATKFLTTAELAVVAAFRLVELQLAEFASLAGVEEMLHADEAT